MIILGKTKQEWQELLLQYRPEWIYLLPYSFKEVNINNQALNEYSSGITTSNTKVLRIKEFMRMVQ